jgi:ribose transport system substrate-binding protein
MRKTKISRLVAPVLLVSALVLSGCASTTDSEVAASSGATDTTAADAGAKAPGAIVLSNSFIGNAWRQTMVDDVNMSAEEAKAAGEIVDFSVVNSNNDVAEQISQMNSLILQKPKVILILAASPTALNGVIQTACDAGIKVLAFDATVTAECAYNLAPDWVAFGEETMQVVVDRLGGKGNVILVHGVDGTDVDLGMSQGWNNVIDANPGINVVGEVSGNWDDATTQTNVGGLLATAPQVDGVMSYVSAYGAIQAFVAANRPIPVVYGSNQGTFLKWWSEQKAATGYDTESAMEGPAISQAAFWIGVNLANGMEYDKKLVYPTFRITNENLDSLAASTAPDAFADQVWTKELVDAQWPPK